MPDMTRIDFYFNAPSKLDVARKLAAKAFASGACVLVYPQDAEQARELDMAFWTAQQLSFLPHAPCGHPLARETPILIGDAPDELASLDILINLADEPPAFFDRFQRVLEIVGRDEMDRERARNRYRQFKQQNYPLAVHDLAEKTHE